MTAKIRPGITLLAEIEGYGEPIVDGDRFEAVYKYYFNRGDPILFDTVLSKPLPTISQMDGQPVIGWEPPATIRSNVVYDHTGWLARQSDIIVGLYYSLLGMRTMGYRRVKIAPPYFSDSVHDAIGIKKGSVVQVELFLLKIVPSGGEARTKLEKKPATRAT